MMTLKHAVSLVCAAVTCACASGSAFAFDEDARIAKAVQAVDPQVRAWRHDFHEHPELSNRELRTSKKVAEVLQGLGLEVRTGVAKTGVVALLRGRNPGPTIAYRAEMDATIGPEQNDLPFRS